MDPGGGRRKGLGVGEDILKRWWELGDWSSERVRNPCCKIPSRAPCTRAQSWASHGEESQGIGHKTSGSHSGRGTVPTAVEGLKLPSGALPEEKKQSRKERPEGKLPWRVNCPTAGDW